MRPARLQVGDRPGNSNDPVKAASRQAHGRSRVGQNLRPGSSGVATWSSSPPSAPALVRGPWPLSRSAWTWIPPGPSHGADVVE